MASCRHFPESGAATFPEFTADISGIHSKLRSIPAIHSSLALFVVNGGLHTITSRSFQIWQLSHNDWLNKWGKVSLLFH